MKPFDPRLVRLVPEVRPTLLALAAIGVAGGVATIGLAFALTALVVATARGNDLATPLVWVAVIFVVRSALAAATEHVAARTGIRAATALRRALIARWSRLGVEDGPDRSDSLALAVSGPNTVEPYAARFLPTLVTAAVVPPLAIVTLACVDWLSALIVVLTVPLLPLFAALIGHATQQATDRRWRALGRLAGHFLDVTRGLPTLLGYGRAQAQAEQVREISDRHRRATMDTLKLAFLSSAALGLLATISVAIVAVCSGVRLAAGSMDLSTAMVAILLAPEAYWPIRRVGQEFHSAADGAAALEAILGELDSPASELPERDTTPAAVTVRGLGYRHPGAEQDVLADLDATFPTGLTVVTGASGAGKSTLLELLAGLRRPSAGQVSAPAAHLMTQRPFIAAGTLRENLTLAHDASETDLTRALAAVGLTGLVAGLPGGMDAVLGDDGFGLSAGQRQRLALARVLLAPEPVLLLDEPTAHLDPETAATMDRAIARLAADRVVVAVTHRDGLRHLADHELILEPLRCPREPAHPVVSG